MATDINYLVRERIQRTLQLRGNTVDQLAQQTGISSAVLRSRMSGRTDFNISELGAIANVLEVGWGDLVELHEVDA